MAQQRRKRDDLMANRTQEYAVRYLRDTMKMDAPTIAKELKLKQTEVEKILGDEQETPKPKKISSKDLMINETSAKKTRNVSIMTQAASQMNDEMLKAMNNIPKHQPGIYRPKG